MTEQPQIPEGAIEQLKAMGWDKVETVKDGNEYALNLYKRIPNSSTYTRYTGSTRTADRFEELFDAAHMETYKMNLEVL